MNFSILHWFHSMFGSHTNMFCHAVIVGNSNVKKVERQSASAYFTWVLRERDAMHATQLFIDRSGVSHAHVECAPGMGYLRQKKYPF